MRYDEAHKGETRRRVVKAAAGAVRARGPDRVGVAEVMAEAGLTHGGFYAHFPSKDALLGAAVGEAFEQSRRALGRIGQGAANAERLGALVDNYVSAQHRDFPAHGCPIALLASDIPRQAEPARRAFDAGVRTLIAQLTEWLEIGPPETREALAGSLVAEMSGAVALSRAVSDPALSDRLLAESRLRLKQRMGVGGA